MKLANMKPTKAKARREFLQLRADDEDFNQQWNKDDFQEWYEDVFIPTI